LQVGADDAPEQEHEGDDMNEPMQFDPRQSGQTMAEYAVVLGVITIAVVATLTLLSGTISSVLQNVMNAM
jgi:Flp pilus assembly pilin Flp